MKIAIAFLLLGVCLVLTNANAIGKRKMSQNEAYSHGRMMALVLKRWNDWKNCHRCNDVERYCMEKDMVVDLCFIVKLMANDMGCSPRELLGTVTFEIHVSYVHNALEHDNTDSLTQELRRYGKMDHFVQSICGMMNTPLKESNVDMGNMLGDLNGILGGGLELVQGLLGTALDVVGGVAKAATDVVGGVVKTATDLLGGLTGGILGGLTKKGGLLG